MHQTALDPSFLHVFDAQSGSWERTTLDTLGSPHIQEAMNTILQKDGILGFIGTRSEFGSYLSELEKDPEKGGRHCWTSLPASTVMSMLGLCLVLSTPERPSLVFHGSPVVLMLSMLKGYGSDLQYVTSLKRRVADGRGAELEVALLSSIGLYRDISVMHSELEEAFSYYEDNILILGDHHD